MIENEHTNHIYQWDPYENQGHNEIPFQHGLYLPFFWRSGNLQIEVLPIVRCSALVGWNLRRSELGHCILLVGTGFQWKRVWGKKWRPAMVASRGTDN